MIYCYLRNIFNIPDPEKIKEYLFGTEVLTDWEMGSQIIFKGEYEGQQYEDKGNVIEKKENNCKFTWHQQGFSSDAGKYHREEGLKMMLEVIKKISEEKPWGYGTYTRPL